MSIVSKTVCPFVCVSLSLCVYVCVYMCVPIPVCPYMCLYVHVRVCPCACVSVYPCVPVCLCPCVSVSVHCCNFSGISYNFLNCVHKHWWFLYHNPFSFPSVIINDFPSLLFLSLPSSSPFVLMSHSGHTQVGTLIVWTSDNRSIKRPRQTIREDRSAVSPSFYLVFSLSLVAFRAFRLLPQGYKEVNVLLCLVRTCRILERI